MALFRKTKILEKKIAELEMMLEKKSDSSVVQRVVYVGGRPIYMWTDEASESNIDRRDINVATAIQLISDALSGLPVVIQTKSPDGWIDAPDHPAEALLTQPNPFHSQLEIVTHIIQCLTCTGDAYFLKEKEKSVEYNRLWPVPPWMMKMLFNKTTGRPAGYLYDPTKMKIPYKLEDVFHIRWYHMSSPFTGSSPIKPAMPHLNNKDKAVKYNAKFFENGASPELVFIDKSGMVDMPPEQQDQFLKSWDARNKGTDNAHKRAVMPPGIEPMVIGSSLKDMLFGDMQKLDREQVYGFLQIPPSEAGIYEFANYANALVQKKTFWENNLIPKKRMIETYVNRQLIWPQWGNEYRMVLDTSDVAALQEDRQIQATSATMLYNGGVIMLNEARRRVGEEPIPDGDIFKPAPINPFGLFDSSGDSGDGGKGFYVHNSLGTKASTSPSPREAKWLLFDEKARREEPEYIKTINRYFNNQMSRVLAALRQSSANGLTFDSWMCKAHYYFGSKDNPPEKLPDDVRRFFDITDENAALEAMMQPLIKQTIGNAGSSFFREYGINLDFNVNNDQVKTLINSLNNRIKLMNDTSYDYLRAMLNEAYDEGWPLSKLEKEIRLQYQNWTQGSVATEARASMIARTETAAAVNGGTLIGYKQGGIEQKEWLASIDSATRDSHASLNGTRVGITERFSNGLDFPGDPSGPAGEVIHCRCTMLPVFE